jgi:hypothetical protein
VNVNDDFPGGPHELRSWPFTTQQALDTGWTHDQLTRAVAARWLRRPFRGVYVPAALPDDLATRCAALSLSMPGEAFICDHAAAWLHAGDRALVPGDHLVVPDVSCFHATPGGRLRRDNLRSGERSVLPHEVVEMHGLRVTTPLRTALDLGRLARSSDLRLHGLDTMLSLGHFDRAELLDEIPRFQGFRGVVGLRALAPLADGGAESYGESALRLRWHQAHLPWPTTQFTVPGTPYRLDLSLPEELFAAEYDGEQFHSTPDQVAHDARRRSDLRRRGWHLEPLRKQHVFGRQQIAEHRLRVAYAALEAVRRSRTYL